MVTRECVSPSSTSASASTIPWIRPSTSRSAQRLGWSKSVISHVMSRFQADLTCCDALSLDDDVVGVRPPGGRAGLPLVEMRRIGDVVERRAAGSCYRDRAAMGTIRTSCTRTRRAASVGFTNSRAGSSAFSGRRAESAWLTQRQSTWIADADLAGAAPLEARRPESQVGAAAGACAIGEGQR